MHKELIKTLIEAGVALLVVGFIVSLVAVGCGLVLRLFVWTAGF